MTFLYIDPGTGSMLFSLFIGIAAAAAFGVRALFLKLKFFFSGGKATQDNRASNIPFVIFSDHKRYWNVFRPICDEFERWQIPLVYYTASPDDPALSAGYRFVITEYLGEGNRPYARLNFLKADVLVSTTPGLEVYQWKRSKDVKCYVHVPHTADDLSGYRMFALDWYDAVLTTGRNQEELIRKIEDLRPSVQKKELVTVGSLTLDNLAARLASAPPRVPGQKKTVLVAPSWGASGILSRYGEQLLSALEKTDFAVIVRPHPQTVVSEQAVLKPLQEKFTRFEWNFDNDNFGALHRADILITDFSGIIFDYALVFDRPLIYADTHFDTLPYDADWLDGPMWSLRVLPELGFRLEEKDFPHIAQVIEAALSDTALAAGRKKIRGECWENCGRSAEKVVDYLVKKRGDICRQ